eukprot:CAMPEP_0171883114 /NCGR_PEP_ID=MMETSP0992-20121227/39987_1 /TAXON_ID=483369 /ORGANISM="non described non described, Strain CCMP2098" /LENGTH=88 /DNA_ID=CAMNT_0012509269 /DNA_START=1 /DNA_END=263 /DNA_ORIENTATION=-
MHVRTLSIRAEKADFAETVSPPPQSGDTADEDQQAEQLAGSSGDLREWLPLPLAGFAAVWFLFAGPCVVVGLDLALFTLYLCADPQSS